jgi:putative spermidine/putrescine transport system permease protein
MKKIQRERIESVPFYILIFAFLALVVGITATVVIGAFSNRWVGTPLPTEWTTYNMRYAWEFYEIGKYYLISLRIVIVATLVSLVCATPTAYVIARKELPFKDLIDKFFKLPILLPELLIGIPLAAIFYGIGLAETYLGVTSVLMVIGIPFGLSILVPFMESLDSRGEIAAETLGANKWHVFTKIIVPQLIPGMTSTLINVFVRLFANYALVLLLGGPGTYTLTIKVFSTLANAKSEAQGLLNALTVYYMIPMLGFTMLSLLLQNLLKRRFGK